MISPDPTRPGTEGEEMRAELDHAFARFLSAQDMEASRYGLVKAVAEPIISDLTAAREERDAFRNELATERLMRISAQASAEYWERRYEDLSNGPNG